MYITSSQFYKIYFCVQDEMGTEITPEDEDQAAMPDKTAGEVPGTSTQNTPPTLCKPIAGKKRRVDESEATMPAIQKDSVSISDNLDPVVKSFGVYVTAKLNNYPPNTRMRVQHEILNTLMKADLGQFECLSDAIQPTYFEPTVTLSTTSNTPTTTPSPQGSNKDPLFPNDSEITCIKNEIK